MATRCADRVQLRPPGDSDYSQACAAACQGMGGEGGRQAMQNQPHPPPTARQSPPATTTAVPRQATEHQGTTKAADQGGLRAVDPSPPLPHRLPGRAARHRSGARAAGRGRRCRRAAVGASRDGVNPPFPPFRRPSTLSRGVEGGAGGKPPFGADGMRLLAGPRRGP